MRWKEFFRPTKLTWEISAIVLGFSLVNLFSLNLFNIGIGNLAMVQFLFPIIVFDSLGLFVGSSSGWFPSPNMLGYILIILSNLLIIYLVSVLIEKAYVRLRRGRS